MTPDEKLAIQVALDEVRQRLGKQEAVIKDLDYVVRQLAKRLREAGL